MAKEQNKKPYDIEKEYKAAIDRIEKKAAEALERIELAVLAALNNPANIKASVADIPTPEKGDYDKAIEAFMKGDKKLLSDYVRRGGRIPTTGVGA